MQKKLSARAIRLLRKVEKHILEEPRRFIMGAWVNRGRPGEIMAFRDYDMPVVAPKCGTAACIGGWLCILSGLRIRSGTYVGDKAAKLIGVDPRTTPLFDTTSWPDKFASEFRVTRDPATRAKIAVKRIEHFIKTGV